ncbi:prostatic steroid-binding protein C1-like [Cricetulus griseus]|uniref:prostatic steroid-binding protein C1-like n=1 Tax=Cricetulus griseus TaxID=10029 RepID=UPI00022F5E42|nr:prostatic steroid-binding protein C1-like [Cricetulus griseus]
MRLSLCLLLVILAVHCYEADAAMVCPAVIDESTVFLKGNEKTYEKTLKKYNPPPEAVEAKLEVKRCVDSNLSTLEKAEIAKVLVLLARSRPTAPHMFNPAAAELLKTVFPVGRIPQTSPWLLSQFLAAGTGPAQTAAYPSPEAFCP